VYQDWFDVDSRELRKQGTRTSERFVTNERNLVSFSCQSRIRYPLKTNKLTARVSISHSTLGQTAERSFRKEIANSR